MTFGTEEQKSPAIDFSKIKLERGTTPENIKSQCFQLCQQYLGGVWLNLTIDEVEVKRLSGGLTNQLYYCAINEDKRIRFVEEPYEVVIRLYQSKHFNADNKTDKRLTDTIIALLLSQNELGPKIYGLFEGGQIQKYYKHKSFRNEEYKDIKLVKDLAQRLARIHAMEVPIKRSGNWLFDYFDESLKLAKERFDLKALIEESKFQTLKTYDIEEELQWLKKAIIESESPHIFTHLDFRGSNIMITESDGIVLCDFEYSCYGYRGFDFGTFFTELGYGRLVDGRVWGQSTQPHEYPSDETIKQFIGPYIEESIKLKGKQFSEDNRNSIENILKEVKLFSLVGFMWTIMFLLGMNESVIAEIQFVKLESMEFLERQYKIYQNCKQKFIEQNVFRQENDTNNNTTD